MAYNPNLPVPLFKSEEQLQAYCFQWAWYHYPDERQMLFHVNNKSKNEIEGNQMKAKGVVKGISDLVLILNHGKIAWLELKTPEGTQSEEQRTFELKLKLRQHHYYIIRTFERFKELYLKLLNLSC